MRDEETIYRILHGSHLYGTNTELSDEDFKEVYVPSGRSILLNRIKEGRAAGPVKEANEKNKPGDIDTQSFAITKLFSMIGKGDIIGCELIFTPEKNVVYKHPWYDQVLENKSIFLSKKVDGYVGYCRTQANKYGIRGSRIAACRALLELLKSFKHTDKLREHWDDLIAFAESHEHTSIVKIENSGTGEWMDHLECCSKKCPTTITVKEAVSIYQRYFDDYGHRALLAEKNEGIDWKAISHAVRVGHQAIELLDTHIITFPRPEAADLVQIKKGEVPYKQVAEYLDRLLQRVLEASDRSTLPAVPDWDAIDELTIYMHKEMT